MSPFDRLASRPPRATPTEPEPALLALEPTMGGWPWDEALSRAASTLQTRKPFVDPPDECLRASIEYAIAHQSAQAIVIAGEGSGLPAGAALAEIEERIRAAQRMAKEIAPERPLTVDFLWLERSARRLYAYAPEAGQFLPFEFSSRGEIVRSLLKGALRK